MYWPTRLATLSACFLVNRGEELAFVDVSSDDQVNIRSLDVPVAAARGADNFFLSNPMEAQDWGSVRLVNRTLVAELEYAKSSVSGKGWRQELRDALAPIYAALPKNEHGRIGTGGMRYALHRLFTARHGWSIKGSEPAGEAWVASMNVTPDVRQLSKYMVPTFLYQLLMESSRHDHGLDLELLTVVAATFEHLVHSEMLKNLYHVYRTLGLATAGQKSVEVDNILETFMMVHAFGTNLELSSLEDVKKARAYLESHHHGWQRLHDLLNDARRKRVVDSKPSAVRGGGGLAFDDVALVAAEAQSLYGRWQSRDCSRAVEELAARPNSSAGRVRLANVEPVNLSSHRALFAESREVLRQLGVLDETEPDDPRLIATNYIQSQAMCLSTSSYFEVCCPSECEEVYLAKLEQEIAAPTGDVDTIVRILAEASGSSVLGDKEKAALREIATDGRVPLHGRSFSRWLHDVFPSKCAAPHDKGDTNPKTADEWLAPPRGGVEATEELLGEVADVLSRYTAAGGADESYGQEELPLWREEDIVRIREEISPPPRNEKRRSSWIWWMLRSFFYVAIAISMMKAAFSLATSWDALSPSDDIKKGESWCAQFA
jgi:hypothetical protein